MNAIELKNQKKVLNQINKSLDSKSVATVSIRLTKAQTAKMLAAVEQYNNNKADRLARSLNTIEVGAYLAPLRAKFGDNKKAFGEWRSKSVFAAIDRRDITDLLVLGENAKEAKKLVTEAAKNGSLAGDSTSYLRKLVLDAKKADSADKKEAGNKAATSGARGTQARKNPVTPASLVAELIAKMTKNEISKQAVADELKKHGF